MVGDDLEGFRCPLEFRAPFLERLDDGEELLVIDFVVALLRGVLPGKVSHGAQPPLIVVLR